MQEGALATEPWAFAGCVDSDGRAYAWGYGSYWQLGTGKTLDGGLPQQVALRCHPPLIAI